MTKKELDNLEGKTVKRVFSRKDGIRRSLEALVFTDGSALSLGVVGDTTIDGTWTSLPYRDRGLEG